MTATGQADEISVILARAARALPLDPASAERWSRDVLKLKPADPRARLVLASSLRRLGDFEAARTILESLAASQTASAPVQIELGLVLTALAQDTGAVAAFQRGVRLNPAAEEAWRAMAAALARMGDAIAAERALRTCLRHNPQRRDARYDLAVLLHRRQADGEALALAEALVGDLPEDGHAMSLLAACAAQVGDYQRAAELYRALLVANPGEKAFWLNLGHALRAVGERAGAIEAYRRCLTLKGPDGEAYWSLANLKASRLSPRDGADLIKRLAAPDADANERLHLHYALGRAREQDGDYAESFEHYAAGAALGRALRPYAPERADAAMASTRDAFTRLLFEKARQGKAPEGCADATPIFIVGLPRVGSTLIEQILASHSRVEGCGELQTLMAIARELDAELQGRYPGSLDALGPARLAAIGERYLAETRIYRRRDRPVFVDKMPNNLHHVGLIRLVLPHARIIDARRSPMAAGFSMFKQHFAAGHAFSYDLRDIGRYYRGYVALMSHYDAVQPGAVLRVDYESLVQHTEREVRRLLAFCGLDYEPACLAFHDNPRAVRTASSEQVRRAIFTEGLEHWRHYEPWLSPLSEGLRGS